MPDAARRSYRRYALFMEAPGREGCVSARVRLAKIDAEVSRLGFGTSALMSRVNRRDSLRLLGTALEHGITHFDTARSYGFGEAESVLGEFLQHRREQITVTTKVGILPPQRTAWLSAAKAAARGMISLVPAARRYVRRSAERLISSQRFETTLMTESLETSLRALRTKYVDFLLLHEPRIDVLRSHEPLEFLHRMREQGKARFVGVATDIPGVICILSELPEYATVLQHPYTIFSETRKRAGSPGRNAVFVHSCLGTFTAQLRRQFEADERIAAEWSRSLDLNITEPGKLEQLTLLTAFADMPQAAILFTSINTQHIRENAAALNAAASSEQVEQFRRLVISQIA